MRRRRRARGGSVLDGEEAEVDAWDEHDAAVMDEVDVDERLAAADRLAAEGAYAAAERAYVDAKERSAAPVEVEADRGAGQAWDDELVDAFLGLFCAGQETHEVAAVRRDAGLRDFVPVERPPGPADVRAHLVGEVALAVRPRLADGTCALGVLDVDGVGAGTEIAVRAHVDALCSVARSWGLEVLAERTGGRGMHVWIPLERRRPAQVVAAVLSRIVREAGRPAEGVRVERLPGGDDEPDLHAQAITLPLGRHVETGERSRLAWAGGCEVEDDGTGMLAGAANDVERLAGVAVTEVSGEGAAAVRVPVERLGLGPGGAVRRVMDGCAVLQHLADKAAAVGHLDHAERLSLLYSLGHLGEAGRRAIHEIVGRCGNYSQVETSRQIGRLSGLPISCTRMREKHVTEELAPRCTCDFGDVRRRGGYPTPLLHANGFRRVWREELRGRRAAEVVARERPAAGVRAVAEANELPRGEGPGEGDEHGGVMVAGVPPHEWA